MKKLIIIILAMTLVMPVAVHADNNLSDMSIADLDHLLKSVQEEILTKSEWTEVELPVGFYVVGEDIPEGHWTRTTQDWALAEYFSKTDETGKNADILNGAYYSVALGAPGNMMESVYNTRETDIELKAGFYFTVSFNPVVFKPYTGRNSPFFN